MSGEFSLLQHLGVSVSEATAGGRPAAVHRNECRVWSPVRRPPLREDVRARERVPGGKAFSGNRYADPANEVLLGREDGKEVEYVIYNAKVPSIYGVNKQLADARRREEAEREERERATAAPPITLEDNQREANRRRLLSELHRCNMAQAQQKHEEQRREAERRAAREADYLRDAELQEQRATEAANARRLAAQRAIDEANHEAAVRRRDAAIAIREAERAYVEEPFIASTADEDYSEAAARRVRALMEDNKMLAARARERQERERELDDIYANRLRMRAAEEEASEQLSRERARARALAYGAEMEKEAAARRAEASREQHIAECPVFLAPERNEEELEAKRARMAEEIREENRRLAERKRAEAAARAEKEKAVVQRLIDEEADAQRQERDREAHKKAKAQEEYRAAMENAIAIKQARLRAERESHSQAVPLLFGDVDAERTEAARKKREYQLAEEQRATAEQRRAARLQCEARQLEAERIALEDESRAAAREESRRRERLATENARLRHELEKQMAQRRGERSETQRAHGDISREPVVPPRALYRCPVTGRLLPAEAYDFGRTR